MTFASSSFYYAVGYYDQAEGKSARVLWKHVMAVIETRDVWQAHDAYQCMFKGRFWDDYELLPALPNASCATEVHYMEPPGASSTCATGRLMQGRRRCEGWIRSHNWSWSPAGKVYGSTQNIMSPALYLTTSYSKAAKRSYKRAITVGDHATTYRGRRFPALHAPRPRSSRWAQTEYWSATAHSLPECKRHRHRCS